MKNLLILLTLTVVLEACSSSRTIMLGSARSYAPTTPEQVIIYVDAVDIPASYTKLAIISTNYASGADKSKWRNVRKKCAAIGANGVIPKMELRASGGAKVAAAIFGTIATDKAEFLAIRVNDNPVARPEPVQTTIRIVNQPPELIPQQTYPSTPLPTSAHPVSAPFDLLVLLNGTQIQAIINEVNTSEIVYKRLTNPTGPVYRVLKTNVSYVRYGGSGEIERFPSDNH